MRALAIALLCSITLAAQPMVLKASILYDGKGQTLRNTILVIEGANTTRVGGAARAGGITYDLTRFTVTPGWIDTHSHVVNHFDNDNRASRAVFVMKGGRVYENVAHGGRHIRTYVDEHP